MYADPRFATAPNIWLATTRPDGQPHLVPIWFVFEPERQRVYVCTGSRSIKARNLRANPQLCLAFEDGTQAFVAAGVAHPVPPDPVLVALFQAKYQWDITADPPYDQVFEIELTKQLMGKTDPAVSG